MPVTVSEEKWEESESSIIIHLPLRGVPKKSVDILTSPKYIKVSYPPNLYERYLFAEIDDIQSRIEFRDSLIILNLQKSFRGLWNCIAHPSSKDPKIMRAVREEALELMVKRNQNEVEDRKKQKQEMHGFAVSELMGLESKLQRETVKILDAERVAFFRSTPTTQQDEASDLESDDEDGGIEEPVQYSDQNLDDLLRKISEIETKFSATVPHKKKVEEPKKIPSVRSCANITFAATPRVFPTPKRESQAELEEEWLRKKSLHSRLLSANGSCGDAEERDPLWLKKKGDSSFGYGDHLSAISFYSHAVQMGSIMPEIFFNRALANYKLGNLHKVLEDVDKALENFTPAVEQNRIQRRNCYWLRGIAFFKLDLPREGLIELQEARKLDPDNSDWVARVKMVDSEKEVPEITRLLEQIAFEPM